MFVTEGLVLEHNQPEVNKAKAKEIQNVEDWNTFEEVEDIGQECIGSCWVITRKEKHDG